MTKQSPAARILVAMYRAANVGRCLTESLLSQTTEIELTRLMRLLEELDRAGYVDRDNLRLTLAGLAIAVAVGARQKTKSYARAA
jgi:DNA-binding IclR family transcriptional regulator